MDSPSLTDGYAAPGNGWWSYAKYPELHRGRVAGYCSSLGNTADRLWDFSGNGNHGTMMPTFTTGPTWDVSEGKYANSFDGVNDYINMPASIVPTGDAVKSVSMWFRCDGTISTRQWIFYSGAEVSYGRFAIEIEASKISFNYYSSNLYGPTPVSGRWYHVVAAYAGGTALSLYIDGIEVASGIISTLNTGTTANTILGRFISAAFPFTGLLDDVQIYNRPLSQNEITQLYQLGRGGSYAIDYEMMVAEAIAAGGPFPHFIRRSQQLSGGLVAC